MNNKKIVWTITDGSQGMVSQVNGLAQHLNKNFIEKKIELKWPWSILQPGFLPIYKNIFNPNFLDGELPSITISCGRKSVYASLYLKKTLKKKLISIHIQNPKINFKKFNFIISPNHDQCDGENIINSVGALHNLNLKKINGANKIFNVPADKKVVTIILGGTNNHYDFNLNVMKDFLHKIKELNSENNKYYCVFIPSRRTESNLIKLIENKFIDDCFIWNKQKENPYLYSLSIADYIIVTSDSTSMISEASSTGKPIFVFHLPFKRRNKRFEYFHKEFEKKGITRPFNQLLDTWKYNSLNESERIAGILKTRILKLDNE